MIKNKELLEIIEQKKNEKSCENCRYCNLGAFHGGRWYCRSPKVSIFQLPVDIENCFERR